MEMAHAQRLLREHMIIFLYFLKYFSNFSDSGDDPIGDSLENKVVLFHSLSLKNY